MSYRIQLQTENKQNQFSIKTFDLKDLCDDSSKTMIAKHPSGMAWTVRDILSSLRKCKIIQTFHQ